MGLASFLEAHGISQRQIAIGSGVGLTAVNDIVNNKRRPRTDTVNRILAFLRRYEPGITYESIWGGPDVRSAA